MQIPPVEEQNHSESKQQTSGRGLKLLQHTIPFLQEFVTIKTSIVSDIRTERIKKRNTNNFFSLRNYGKLAKFRKKAGGFRSQGKLNSGKKKGENGALNALVMVIHTVARQRSLPRHT
ncbi:hypothetical protein X798_00346 [Onchocerca flexuosa]|uniref:Uncharacterized protein n=1 Tax=Onchocerca flexuosa TaxID=387005 RepID=A0A238C5W7_9BILA|nr:hypothetical protein X798_00346 [Onchocerca flexuosa]